MFFICGAVHLVLGALKERGRKVMSKQGINLGVPSAQIVGGVIQW